MPSSKGLLPAIETLYQRHIGLTDSVCHSFAEAASVCLSRHHSPPKDLRVLNGGRPTSREVNWNPPDDRTKRTWNNLDDTTEYGAYGICIAVVEVELSLNVVGRADTRTGADWYLGSKHEEDNDDLEATYRLEVSGIDRGNQRDLTRRLNQKIVQIHRGASSLPAIASVTVFSMALVGIEKVDQE